MGIEQKTTGMLIDELFTTNMKCWYAQESIMKETDTIRVAEAAKNAQDLNNRRNQLIRAIDRSLGQESSTFTSKTYNKD